MENLSFVIGVIGNVISILVFASPIGTFKRVVKKRSVEEFKAIPYVCTLLSTSLWTYYGLLKPGGLLVLTVNGVGVAMEAIYVAVFLIFSPKDARIKLLKLVVLMNVGLFGGIVAVSLLAVHSQHLRLTVIGVICAGITLGMYASPLASMRSVVVTKSVEYMPFSLSFFLFLNGGIWSTYAILVKDLYIGVPNSIGFVLGTLQLILYTTYKYRLQAKSSKEIEDSSNDVEMQRNAGEHDEEDGGEQRKTAVLEQDGGEERKIAILRKGKSLPKPPVLTIKKSFQRIAKSISMSVYELRSDRFSRDAA